MPLPLAPGMIIFCSVGVILEPLFRLSPENIPCTECQSGRTLDLFIDSNMPDLFKLYGLSCGLGECEGFSEAVFKPNQTEKCTFKQQLTDLIAKEGCPEQRCGTSIILSILLS